jgi:hypothetical protein
MSDHDARFQEAIRQILRRAAIDNDFRRLALKDSAAAFAKFGINPPQEISVDFIENFGKSRKTIVLPDPVAQVEELTDEDLEEVAGGTCVVASDLP